MRTVFLAFLTVSLIGCGSTDAAGSDADVSSDTASDTALGDASGSDATSGDTAGTDAASGDATGTDAITSDSPWAGQLFLNEIHAGGDKTAQVATAQDWIELYNIGGKNLDLAGCKLGGLTNGLAGADVLPAGTSIPAGSFLVVYFNHNNLGVPVINAGIKSDGSMGLWDKDGLLVDAIDWAEGASPAGSSYDRVPDGSATWKTVTPPTPGTPNSK